MTDKEKKVIYHGGGYVGYTGALYAIDAGYDVVIYDVSEDVVKSINSGIVPIYGLDEFISDLDDGIVKKLRATNDYDDIIDADVHIFAVPTEKNGEPFFDILWNSLERLVSELNSLKRSNVYIIVESTVYPGFANDFKKKFGDYGFGFIVAPRRDWFVNKEMNVRECERVIGVDSDEDRKWAEDFYLQISNHIHWTDTETAEIVKQLENAMLYNSVVFLLDFAKTYQDKDTREIVRLACTHWRMPNYFLSLGLAGYCVPLGMKYLTMKNDLKSGKFMIDTEREYRDIICNVIRKNVSDGRVLILGISDKPNYKIPHLSPAIYISKYLTNNGIGVDVHDCLFSVDEMIRWGCEGNIVSDIKQIDFSIYDVVVIHTPYNEYLDLRENLFDAKMIIDGCGLFADYNDDFINNGVDYRLVGSKNWLS